MNTFQGHFPKEPVLPGVIIIEALAQVGAVALLDTDEFKGKTAYFGGIKMLDLEKKVVQGYFSFKSRNNKNERTYGYRKSSSNSK